VESAERVLRERARALATVLEVAESSELLEVIQFRWGQETYAMESRFVREAYRLRDLTWVPCTPHWILGLVNVRSQVLAVVDIRSFLGLPAPAPKPDSRLLILQDEAGQFGVLVDSIEGVRQLRQDEVSAATVLSANVRAEYVLGITPERLILLSGQAILGDRRLEVQSEPTIQA
jgi:purine-binding chemotaxis protein CheW